jgi:hypothetical protein
LNKIKTLRYINPIIGLLILSQLLSGLFNRMLHYETFEIIHKGGGILFFVVVIIHVALNWSWVKTTYLRKR